MRFIIQIALTSVLNYFLQQAMPPWIVVVSAAAISCIVPNSPLAAFWGGFVAISLLWMIKATMIDVSTHSILSLKMVPLLGLKNPMMLILLTGFIGGLLGGLGAASGQHLVAITKKKHADIYKI